MRRKTLFLLLCLLGFGGLLPAQRMNPDFDAMLQRLLRFSVETVDPGDLFSMLGSDRDVFLLDARSEAEFEVSHIYDARLVGYEEFRKADVADIPKDAIVVVYCSVGYRSERIGEKLLKLGYSEVYNLYGGIFQWVNAGGEVVRGGPLDEEPTNRVHPYDEEWGKWLEKGQKAYE